MSARVCLHPLLLAPITLPGKRAGVDNRVILEHSSVQARCCRRRHSLASPRSLSHRKVDQALSPGACSLSRYLRSCLQGKQLFSLLTSTPCAAQMSLDNAGFYFSNPAGELSIPWSPNPNPTSSTRLPWSVPHLLRPYIRGDVPRSPNRVIFTRRRGVAWLTITLNGTTWSDPGRTKFPLASHTTLSLTQRYHSLPPDENGCFRLPSTPAFAPATHQDRRLRRKRARCQDPQEANLLVPSLPPAC
ncbi:hypothetical protein V8F20_012579 [Naviculisporaceae sp. PSN 640]